MTTEGIRSSHLMAEYELMAGGAESVLQHSTLHTAIKSNCEALADLLVFFISSQKEVISMGKVHTEKFR